MYAEGCTSRCDRQASSACVRQGSRCSNRNSPHPVSPNPTSVRAPNATNPRRIDARCNRVGKRPVNPARPACPGPDRMGHAIGTLGPLPFAQGRAWIDAGMLEHRRRHLSDPLQVGLPMLSVLDLLRRIDGGTLTPEGAVRLAREAIFSQDERIGAFVSVDAAAPVGREGPLRGIAVGVKDIIDTADLPTECGSPVYAGWRPKADAPIVAAARRAGATVIGKTATTPFAYLDPTVTRNPSNREHTPGGSSSGSA